VCSSDLMPRGKLVCWRCGSRDVVVEFEELDDVKLRYYRCDMCNTRFYDAQDIGPYIVRLRKQLHQFLGPAEQKVPEGMTQVRPA
jgi:hypothetical protein